MWRKRLEDAFKAMDAIALTHWVLTAVVPLAPSVFALKKGEPLLEHWVWSVTLLVGLGVLHPLRKALTAEKPMNASAAPVKSFIKGNDNQIRIRESLELHPDMQGVEGDRNQIDAGSVKATR